MAALTEKVALITGSSSGMGRSIALAFGAEGAAVVCADVRRLARSEGPEAALDLGTDELIRRAGGDATFIEADVSDAASVEALFTAAAAEHGRLDVLVNNAGLMVSELLPIQDDSEENYERIMSVNARGVWLCCRAAVGQMISQPLRAGIRGKIINVSSISAIMAQPDFVSYHGSKGAAMSMTYALAVECGPHRITVNALAPGAILTAMTAEIFAEGSAARAQMEEKVPLRALGRPDDLAGPAVFLASPASDYVTGAMLPVDGGLVAV